MQVHLFNYTKTFDLKAFQKVEVLPIVFKEPLLLLKIGKEKHVVFLKYGIAVFWNCSAKEEQFWLEKIKPFCEDLHRSPLEDREWIALSNRVEGIRKGKMILHKIEPNRVALVSLILGRSIALEYYEIETEKALREFSSVMKSFRLYGKSDLSTRELLKRVGFAMSLQHLAVSEMSLLDKPDLTWENPELDRLYGQLSEEYELEDRYDVITEKLKLLFHNIEFIVDIIDSRKNLWLEATIVILIIFEIGLFIFEILK